MHVLSSSRYSFESVSQQQFSIVLYTDAINKRITCVRENMYAKEKRNFNLW